MNLTLGQFKKTTYLTKEEMTLLRPLHPPSANRRLNRISEVSSQEESDNQLKKSSVLKNYNNPPIIRKKNPNKVRYLKPSSQQSAGPIVIIIKKSKSPNPPRPVTIRQPLVRHKTPEVQIVSERPRLRPAPISNRNELYFCY